ncbi:hypothetical protein [Bacillus sp. SLBN-46]|uniref:hypothetical protein n=1 Tax=Bacillus sp. SLBN-46 TaxID=3042283 RepID=UPI00286A9AD5|nr:hypothetical protein [Bacillus sp. SLBN-46]
MQFRNLEARQKELTIEMVEVKGAEVMENSNKNSEFKSIHKELTGRMDNLLSGQTEIKNMLKHTTEVMTENFTYLKRDIKSLAYDINSDFDLLFKEIADVKRKVNKLEQR